MRLYHLKLIPHVYALKRSGNRNFVYADIQRWLSCMKIEFDIYNGFKFLMYNYPEFRSLFYYRIGGKRLLKLLLPEMPNLYIYTKEIGKGLFIQHGFSTIILAKTIGENCWVNQQVTIGYTEKPNPPVILNNVTINAGAKVIGDITIGNNCIIGANAVVTKNVPDNCTVVGVPAYIIKRNGVKVLERL